MAQQAIRPRLTIGFAAESQEVIANAQAKLARKNLDLIVANDISRAAAGFEVDENELQVFWDGGSQRLARSHKTRLARELIALVAERYHATGNGNKVIDLHAQDSA